MVQRQFQFTTARLLCAMVTIAVTFAVLFSVSEHASSGNMIPPPRWFIVATRWLTIVGLTSLLGATTGVLCKGEEGFVFGTACGTIVSIAVAPVAMFFLF